MIYTLTITAVSGAYLEEECVRVLEIDERATLEDLHLAIQKAVSFDNDHLYDFYAGRHYRNRQIRYSVRQSGGNQAEAARRLGWHPYSFRCRCGELGVK